MREKILLIAEYLLNAILIGFGVWLYVKLVWWKAGVY